MNNDNDIWIATLTYGGGILTALGLGKVVPAFIKWWEEKREERKQNKALKYKELTNLTERIEQLEQKLKKHENFEVKTKTAFNSMIPLMKEMMKDHPNYVRMLEQLEENIFGEPLEL